MDFVNEKELNTAIDFLLEASQKSGVQAEVSVGVSTGYDITVQNRKPQSTEFHQDNGLGLVLFKDGRKASVSGNDLSLPSLKALHAKALEILAVIGEDSFSGLPDKNTLCFNPPAIPLYSEERLSMKDALEMALIAEDAALQTDKRISSMDAVSVESNFGYAILANTLGFKHGYATSRFGLSAGAIAQEGDSMEREYEYTTSRQLKNLDSPLKIGQLAAQKALARLNPQKISTQKIPVLFKSDVASTLWSSLLGAIAGSRVYRDTTFLKNAIGTQLFPSWFNLVSEPNVPWGMASVPFDAEGVTAKRTEFVKDGVLQSYMLSTYSARRLGLQTTGHAGGAHTIMVPAQQSFVELLQTMGTGLLVTDLMGSGANFATGDYSKGVNGFWVENGAIAYPVHEATIAGNLKDMWMDIVAIGTDTETRGSVYTGSVLVGAMMVGGSGG